jgi:uncharacterized protein YaaN involved in tellurite resistance
MQVHVANPVDTALQGEHAVAHSERALKFVRELTALSFISPEFSEKVDQLVFLGRAEIAEAAAQSAVSLDRSSRAMDRGATVQADLAQLRHLVDQLDPGKHTDLLSPKKLFGLISRGNGLHDYFDRYQSLQLLLSATLARLASDKDDLLKDNAVITVERDSMLRATGRLEQMLHFSKTLQAKLQQSIAELALSDPGKAAMLEKQALFHTRQRLLDMQTQWSVSLQGYQALKIIEQNNAALVQGIDSILATSLVALRTAVTASAALTEQQLVLNNISAFNEAAAFVGVEADDQRRRPSARIEEETAQAGNRLASLQRAFDNLYMMLDNADTRNVEASSSLKASAHALANHVQKAVAQNAPIDIAQR